jgi:toxin secretion/phage lysis holin
MRNLFSIKNIIISIFVIIFGKYWYIFVGFMVLNIIDWLTGLLKAISNKDISSHLGFIGLIKKLGYWVIIGIAFFLSYIFVKLGNEIFDINLSVMYLLGWFTLISLINNEIISILENLAILNIRVPSILTKSLKISKKLLSDTEKRILNKKDKSKTKKSNI